MYIEKYDSHILVIFNNQELESGLIDLLEKKMTIFGASRSVDKMTWNIDERNTEKFYGIVREFTKKNNQLGLF